MTLCHFQSFEFTFYFTLLTLLTCKDLHNFFELIFYSSSILYFSSAIQLSKLFPGIFIPHGLSMLLPLPGVLFPETFSCFNPLSTPVLSQISPTHRSLPRPSYLKLQAPPSIPYLTFLLYLLPMYLEPSF